MLIVILSFVSFWIDHKSVRLSKTNEKKNIYPKLEHQSIQVPARISVGLLTVLTVTTQSSGNINQGQALHTFYFTPMLIEWS
jgi:hypothetical protein